MKHASYGQKLLPVQVATTTGGDSLKNKIKDYRTQRGMTQQDLADLVRVSVRTIISLEKGRYNPSLMLAYRLALTFDTTIEELYCLQENKEMEESQHEEI